MGEKYEEVKDVYIYMCVWLNKTERERVCVVFLRWSGRSVIDQRGNVGCESEIRS